jgi:hypothetical protein
MATTKPTNRRHDATQLRWIIRKYRAVITAGVEGVALVLRLPLLVHVVVTVVTELAISQFIGRGRPR